MIKDLMPCRYCGKTAYLVMHPSGITWSKIDNRVVYGAKGKYNNECLKIACEYCDLEMNGDSEEELTAKWNKDKQ